MKLAIAWVWTVAYALLVAWTILCFGAVIWIVGAVSDDYGSPGYAVVALVVAGSVGFPLGLAPWYYLNEYRSPVLATLKKGEWICSTSRVENSVGVVVIDGKVGVAPAVESVCIQYSKVG